MNKTVRFCRFIFWSCCLLAASGQSAWADHIQGGQLTYRNVGTNQYIALISLYKDCSSILTVPPDLTLLIQHNCSAVAVGSYLMSPVPNTLQTGINQYCPAQQVLAICSSVAALPNYQTQQYATPVITIAPGQWLLSVDICCRTSTANLLGQNPFHYEATLNNQITVNGQPVTIQNNSPQYAALDVGVPFVYYNQSTTIGFNTDDPDNTRAAHNTDSLVYSLDSPWAQCNVPAPYKPYPVPLPTLVAGSNPTCYIVPPATGVQLVYSPVLPIAVGYNADPASVCPTLQGTTPKFRFDPRAGQFTFTPNRYLNTPPNLGDNKYVVIGKVEEYRRLPGSNRRYLVGSVRRELLVIVINGTDNVPNAPTAAAVTPGSGAVVVSRHDSLEVTLQPCAYAQVLVRFTDPDPTDRLSVVYTGPGTVNADALANGDIGTYQLLGDSTAHPVARFLFQPAPSYAGQVIYIPFKIQDNACPVRGTQTRVLVVRIAPKRNLAVAAVAASSPGLGNALVPSVCLGGTLNLQGESGRPDSVRGQLQTYLYAWTGNGIVGSASTKAISVHPTVTTRYRLVVSPASGFPVGACADTTSVLVRVVGPPTVRLTTNNTTVCAGLPVTLTAAASRPGDALTDTYTYTWSGPNVSSTASGPTLSVTPSSAGTYTVVAHGNLLYGCEATAQIQLSVAPAAVAAFTQTSAVSVLPGVHTLAPPVVFTFANASHLDPVTTGFQLDSARWTYQLVRTAGGESVTASPVRFSSSRTQAVTPPLGPGYYLIRLSVSTRAAATNCTENVAEQTVFVPNFELPNIITPNGDNLNDVFVVGPSQVGRKLEIYNRWGRKVMEYSAYQNNWDGTGLPGGMYYYYITEQTGNKVKGWVEIVR